MLDSFGRNITYLRLSVTELCNLRCRYCMPEAGVCKKRHEDMLTEDEMIRAVEAAASLGIEKLRITGGEPLVKKNILSICRRSAKIDGIREVCLTTNGILLPELAQPLRDAGVSRINLSLDTLRPERYAHITRLGKLDDALRGLDAALNVGFEKIKINAVLMGGVNDDEIADLAALTLRYPVDIRFIELMPMGEQCGTFLSADAVLAALPELTPLPADGSVACRYRLPNALGDVGLIRPISAHFCSACNRIRLTADGKLKSCLHSAEEFPIKGMNLSEMTAQFRQAIAAKPGWHGVLSEHNQSRAGRNMNQIGG